MNLNTYTMSDRPSKRTLITTGCYWYVTFLLLPIFLLYLTNGFSRESPVLIWVQVIYYAVNALCAFFIFREHLEDGWFTFRIDPKRILTTVLVCVGIAVVFYTVVCVLGMTVPGLSLLAYCNYALPVSELEVFMMPADLVELSPVLGILSLTVFTPLTVSCLLYGLGFAAPCNVSPLLGYGVALAVLGAHRILNYYTVGTVELEWILFFVQLPAHLLACEAYRRTDSIVAPILFHMILNLLACLLVLL